MESVMTRVVPLLVVVVVALSAGSCGGDSGDDVTSLGESASTVADGTFDATPIEVAETIVATLGPDDAFLAVLLALDGGYTVDQVVTAGLDGTLGADGRIAGIDPIGSPSGLIAAPPVGEDAADEGAAPLGYRTVIVAAAAPTAAEEKHTGADVSSALLGKLADLAGAQIVGARLGISQDNWDAFRPRRPAADAAPVAAPNSNALFVGLLIGLVDAGYSIEQFVEGFVFGDWEEIAVTQVSTDSGDIDCIVLFDGDGGLVPPASRGSDVFAVNSPCRDAIKAANEAGEDDGDESTSTTDAPPEDASPQEATTTPPATDSATTEPSTTFVTTTTNKELRAEGVFDVPVTDDVTIIANYVELLIVDTEVTFDAFDWTWSYTHPAPADCVKTGNMRFLESSVTYDPADKSFRGTVTANDKSDDEGAACPFGGGHRDVDRVGDVEGTLENGTIKMTISFPTVPKAFETILPIAAQTS